jgi:hypothetical protein
LATIIEGGSPLADSGEQPYVVFVSSVMRPDVIPYRSAARNVLREVPGVRPWLFEDAPASSESLEQGYLRPAADAEALVVILAGDTTPAVATEVAEAVARRRRLWVFRVEGETGEVTDSIIETIRPLARYHDVSSPDGLAAELSRAIRDEMLRGLRGQPTSTRRARVEQLLRMSEARCRVRWRALGVAESVAADLAVDRAVGAPRGDWWPNQEQRVVAIVGEFGSGKSLTAERIFQSIASRAINGDPVAPVWTSAKECERGVEASLRSSASEVGDPLTTGAFLIVDGLDEVDRSTGKRIAAETVAIAEAWPNTRALLTTRPLGDLPGVSIRTVPQLTEKEAIALAARFSSGRFDMAVWHDWPGSIRDAIRRPMFAVLAGVYVAADTGLVPRSRADLLTFLVEKAFDASRSPADPTRNALEELATRLIDGEAPPRETELRAGHQLEALLETGLVEKRNDGYSFPLPILGQWFAAQALVRGVPSVHALLRSGRLDRWRYPLMIALGSVGDARVDDLLTSIAEAEPAFAGQLIDSTIPKWGMSDVAAPSDPLEAGRRILYAMDHLRAGVGPLDALVAPTDRNGAARPLGVATKGEHLYAAWYSGPGEMSRVVRLPDGSFSDLRGWNHWRMARPGKSAGWNWRWAIEDLKAPLTKLLRERTIPTADPTLLNERHWCAASAVLRHGSVYLRPIDLAVVDDELQRRLGRVPNDVPITLRGHTGMRSENFDLRALAAHVRGLRDHGRTEWDLGRPFPDFPAPRIGSWMWSYYSRERLLSLIEAVFRQAIPAYVALVEEWFPSFLPRLGHYQLLPCRINLTLEPAAPPDDSQASVALFIEPLMVGSSSVYEFSIRTRSLEDVSRELGDADQIIAERRPSAAEWLWPTIMSKGIFDFLGADAVTTIVYDWLLDDLRKVKWQ